MVKIIPVGKRMLKQLSGFNRASLLHSGLPNRGNISVARNGASKGALPNIPGFNNLVHGRLFSDDFREFIKGHKLEELILRPLDQLISTDEITKQIVANVNFDLGVYESGSIPASTNPMSTYSKFGWTRDIANKIIAMIETGCYEEAIKGVYCLAEFYNQKEQRDILTSYHWYTKDNSYEPAERYRNGKGGHVPIRAAINEQGRLVKSDHPWAHNQLDAIGAWLYVTFHLANVLANPLNPDHRPHLLKELDEHLNKNINGENRIDSIFSVAFKTLNRIRCWDNYDVGAWEDISAYKRASSIGICLAATKEAKKYFGDHDWNTVQICDENNFHREIDNLIENCQKSLNERIPKDGREAIECDAFPSDSALSFLLYPYNPGLEPGQELAILRTLYNNRIGDIGFTRRDMDNYVGMNYNSNIRSEELYSNLYVPDYKAAEWTLFDSNLATFFLEKVEKKLTTEGIVDRESLELSEFHFRRVLAQINKSDDTYIKRFYVPSGETMREQTIHTKKGQIPEAYFYDSFYTEEDGSTHGRWRANENTPLLWAEANFLIMLKKQLVVKGMLENYFHDIWKLSS